MVKSLFTTDRSRSAGRFTWISAAAVVACLLVHARPLEATPMPVSPGCTPPDFSRAGLGIRPGYLDFILPSDLAPFKAALPRVTDPQLAEMLSSPDTIWYDEASMVFLYQDSIESVVGGRANCVGRSVGERNRNIPGIAKLLNYFGTDYRFKFPFRTAAGTDNVTNIKVINFWVPPHQRQNGEIGAALPVKWWRDSARGRWRWVFPTGTVFGEVLYEKGPDHHWYVFEIRTRKRYANGWAPSIFRPFTQASSLAEAVMARRPNWRDNATLRIFVEGLYDSTSLTPAQMVSPAFGSLFPQVPGALDILPEPGDQALIAELLTETPFHSSEGEIWKENGTRETYAPASSVDFSVVPKGYEMGLIPVNEDSCNRCHQDTGARLGKVEFDIILYGEIWGEDRIFTWHPFEPNPHIFDTWDDVDVSRKINPRLQQAGLLQNERPSAADPVYKPLPAAYDRP